MAGRDFVFGSGTARPQAFAETGPMFTTQSQSPCVGDMGTGATRAASMATSGRAAKKH